MIGVALRQNKVVGGQKVEEDEEDVQMDCPVCVPSGSHKLDRRTSRADSWSVSSAQDGNDDCNMVDPWLVRDPWDCSKGDPSSFTDHRDDICDNDDSALARYEQPVDSISLDGDWRALPTECWTSMHSKFVHLENKEETIPFNIDDEVVYNESHDAVVLVTGNLSMKGCARIHSKALDEIWVSASSLMPKAP